MSRETKMAAPVRCSARLGRSSVCRLIGAEPSQPFGHLPDRRALQLAVAGQKRLVWVPIVDEERNAKVLSLRRVWPPRPQPGLAVAGQVRFVPRHLPAIPGDSVARLAEVAGLEAAVAPPNQGLDQDRGRQLLPALFLR